MKSSVSYLGAFPFDNHLGICLQGGLFSAFGEGLLTCQLLEILGVGSGVDAMSGVILGCAEEGSGVRLLMSLTSSIESQSIYI